MIGRDTVTPYWMVLIKSPTRESSMIWMRIQPQYLIARMDVAETPLITLTVAGYVVNASSEGTLQRIVASPLLYSQTETYPEYPTTAEEGSSVVDSTDEAEEEGTISSNGLPTPQRRRLEGQPAKVMHPKLNFRLPMLVFYRPFLTISHL